MRVGAVGSVGRTGYTPLSRLDNLKAWAGKQIRQARAKNETQVELFIKDNPTTAKLVEFLQKNFEVSITPSDSTKVTIKF